METRTQRKPFPALALVALALVGLSMPAQLRAQETVAAQQPLPAAAAPQAVPQISPEQLAQYVSAYTEIGDVRERINAEFARTGNKIGEAQTELRRKRHEEVKKIIEEHGMTAEEYETITWVLSVDNVQREAFAQLVAQQAGGAQ